MRISAAPMYLKCRLFFLWSCVLLVLGSCQSLRQNILFQTDKPINAEVFKTRIDQANTHYAIEPGDYLAISVFTDKGERIMDPNNDFELGKGGGSLRPQQSMGTGIMQPMMDNPNSLFNLPITGNGAAPHTYMVDAGGYINLPLAGPLKVAGLTLRGCDSLLATAYKQYYSSPYAVTQYLNKRVVVFGAMGDRVIALRNERMTLHEVLAMMGNFQLASKPNRIRVMRSNKGDWTDLSVTLVDFTTVEGFSKGTMVIQPNDIIYVEPRRRIDRETLNDVNVFVGSFTGILTLIFLIRSINR